MARPEPTIPAEMRRIVVLGVTGAGKTTMAAALAGRMGVPHIELDAIQWRENWTKAPLGEILAEVKARVQAPAWVADGNYPKVRPALWGPADTIVWLDYSLWRCLWRVILRTIRRVQGKELLWGGNHESIRKTLLSKDGLPAWAVRTYGRYRREFEGLMQGSEYEHLRWVRLRTPREAARWLARVPVASDVTTFQEAPYRS